VGRQINFFLAGDEESEFIDFIYTQGGSIIDRFGRIMSKKEVILETFWQIYITFPQSVIDMKNNGRIDDFTSNVIEYDRSVVKEKKIAAGRMYVELIGYDEQGNKFRKEKWLEEKFNIYKKWIIKHCKISKDKEWYIGIKTYLLYKNQGYRMVDSLSVRETWSGIEF